MWRDICLGFKCNAQSAKPRAGRTQKRPSARPTASMCSLEIKPKLELPEQITLNREPRTKHFKAPARELSGSPSVDWVIPEPHGTCRGQLGVLHSSE